MKKDFTISHYEIEKYEPQEFKMFPLWLKITLALLSVFSLFLYTALGVMIYELIYGL